MNEQPDVAKGRPGMEDLLFGVFLIVLAILVFIATRKLAVGTASDMGPGYFPRALAWGALAFGTFFTGKSFVVPGERVLPPFWRGLFFVSLSTALFAFLLMKVGLALASFLAMVVGSMASKETRPVEIIVFSAVMSAGAVLLFVQALALPVPVFFW